MDLTCPSFVSDKTSDYGSCDTSDNDYVIGGLTILAYPQAKTIIFRGTGLLILKDDSEKEIQNFSSPIRALCPVIADGVDILTEDGLYILQCITLVEVWPADAVLLCSGDFQGLEVLGAYSEDPIVLTTEKIHGVIMVTMIDADTGDVVRRLPVSCLTSDIVMWSRVTKLSLDRETKELYITDSGAQIVVKVGLLRNSSCQFGWTGRYLDVDLSWILPSPSGVHICTILKENSTLMTFSKNGELLKKTDIGINIVDGVLDDAGEIVIATEFSLEKLSHC